MPASPAPTEPAAMLAWLVDRACIGDLLVEFARALDERDWRAYAATYTEDGVLDVPGVQIEGRESIEKGSEYSLGRYAGTWHLSSNHAIDVQGDTATTRSYLLAAHLLGGGADDHADGGGWYDCTLRRTAEGWRFTSVHLREVWTNGPIPHTQPPTG